MRPIITAVLAAATPSCALAVDLNIAFQPAFVDFDIYRVSTSPLQSVATLPSGGNLVAFTVTITNIGGDPQQDINGIGAVTVGANGALHHEQAPNPIPAFVYATPAAVSFSDVGLPVSTVDSHFIHPANLPLPGGGEPTETIASVPSGVPVEQLDAVFPNSTTGFGGVLTASYALPTTYQSVDILRLVIKAGNFANVDFTLRPTNQSGVSETLSGRFIIIVPEPASALLAGAALLGFAARRY